MDTERGKLPDLVADTRLVAEVHATHTNYFNTRVDSTGSLYVRRTRKRETWTRTKRLGSGATGEVWLEECHAASEQGRARQAVKVVSKDIEFNVYEELETIAKFSQTKYEGLFVKSLGWYEDEKSIFIVMEHMKYGSLASHLTVPLPEEEVKQITVQVLDGLGCLHENGFVHRDLKPDNILVASKGPRWWVKIGEFGFSKRTSGDSSLHSIVGTRRYFAPEMLGLSPLRDGESAAGGPYRRTYAMDIWSFGVRVFYMLCHDYPFQDRELLQYFNGSSFPVGPLVQHSLSQDACDFVKALLVVDPSTRLSAAAAKRHTWLASIYDKEAPEMPEGGLSFVQIPIPPSTADIQTDSLGASDTDTLISSYRLSSSLLAQGKLDTAHKIIERTTQIQKRVLGAQHEDTLLSLQLGGRIYYRQGKHGEALELLNQVALIRAARGDKDAHMRQGLQPRARALHDDQQYQPALCVLKQIVDASSSPPDFAPSLDLLDDLGHRLDERGDHADAQYCFETASGYRKELLEPLHPQTLEAALCAASSLGKQTDKIVQAQTALRLILSVPPPSTIQQSALARLHHIGETLWHRAAYTDAYSAFEKVLQGHEALRGRRHEREKLRSSAWMGRSLLGQRRYSEATARLQSVYNSQSAPVGSGHLDLGYTSLWLGQALHSSGDGDAAHSHLLMAVAIFRGSLGAALRDLVSALACLGCSYAHTRNFSVAERTLQEALGIGERVFPVSHAENTKIRINLGVTLYIRKKYKQALQHLETVADAQTQALGKTHDDTLDTMCSVGATLDGLRHYAESERYWRLVAEAQQGSFEIEDPDTQTAVRALALSLAHQGKWKESALLQEQVLKARQKTFGPSHAAIVESKDDVKRCNKGLEGKWVILWPERRKLEYRYL
ncbi:kinase-like domain-containing protein [Aspergillus insuetus]